MALTRADMRTRIAEELGLTDAAPLEAEDVATIDRKIDDVYSYLQQKRIIVFEIDNTPDYAAYPMARLVASSLVNAFNIPLEKRAAIGSYQANLGRLHVVTGPTETEEDSVYF